METRGVKLSDLQGVKLVKLLFADETLIANPTNLQGVKLQGVKLSNLQGVKLEAI